MEIFIDSANIEEIKEIISWGIADGCTTNPKIASKEKDVSFETNTKEILKIVDGQVSIEVTTNELDGMLSEAEKYASWGKNVVVKIPIGTIGLKAVKILKEKGIKTNVTACMSPVKCRLRVSIGTTWLYPPPAAPPLIPKVGPIDGCRIAIVAFFPMCLNP